jgi:hypothetical protein
MFTLSVMCTYLTWYYERNNQVRKVLEDLAENFPAREDVMAAINETAEYIYMLNLW